MIRSLSKLSGLPVILCLVLNFSYLFAQTNVTGIEELYRNVTVTRWTDPTGSEPTPYQDWKDRISVTPFQSNRIYQSSLTTNDKVLVIVNSSIYPSIQGQLNQYIIDLESQNYAVTLVTTTNSGNPQDIRSILQGEVNLVGAVLIGDLPIPWFQIIETWDGGTTYQYEEFPCDLYYMDLNGTWADTKSYDTVSKSFVDGADGIFESHTGTIEPEIWIGRLTASVLTSGNEIDLINNYFDKNHQYRSAQTSVKARAITYIDDDWSSWTTCGLDSVYSSVTVVNDKEITKGSDYKDRLDDNYLWIQVCAHSWPGGHSFKYNNGNNTDWVYVNDIKTIDPVAYFYNLFACSNARYVETDYMGGWYIFVDSYGLGAVGTTKTGSMLVFEEFYDPLAAGATLGDAFKLWFINRASGGFEDWEKAWFYGMTLLGDPALTCATPYTLPDLAGKSISFTPTSTTQGADVSFTSTIENQGNVAAGTFHLNYYLSDDNTNFDYGNATYIGTDMISAINPLSSESSTTNFQIPSTVLGDYYVWIVIDPLNAVTEAYEINNKYCSTNMLSVQINDFGLYKALQVPTNLPVPAIDGILDESIWNYADKDSLLFGDTENWGQPWTNFDDNLVVWRAVWSPATNRLYVAVEVTDDSTGTFDDNNENDPNYYPWNDESIEFFTDGDNSGGEYRDRYDIAQQWRVSGQNIRNLNNYPSATYNSIYNGTDFVTAVRHGSKGNWVCESVFTIYNLLPAQPKILTEGDVIGWEIWYNDCDDETWENGHFVRDNQTGWKYSGQAYFYADYFGDMILGPFIPPDSINVTINQIDATGFPTINSYVSVYDLVGNAITGLNEKNFIVEEDETRELPITVVPYGGAQKVNVAMAMDYSGSMTSQAISDMETAAHTFVNLMESIDEGAIFKFSSTVQKMIGFTPDKNALNNAINTSFPGAGQGTALYDAIYDAVTEAIGKSGRKAELALTDGKDTGSSHSVDQIIAHANQYSTPVFTIGLGTSINEAVLKKIANETGGEYYRAPTSSELEEIYKKISQYLKNQYLVTYKTHNPQRDGTWRNVFIQVNSLNSTGSDTSGYRAPSTDSLDIWIAKNHQGPSGGIVTIPVRIGEIANKEIFAVGLQVSYDSQILLAMDANTLGAVTQIWGPPTYEIFSDKIKVGMAGSTALPDSGRLVNIVFNVLGSEGQTTTLHFDEAMLNEGIPPTRTDDGFFRVTTQHSISGKIGYYSDFVTKPVPKTIVHLTDGTVVKDTTDMDGYYEFVNLGQLNFKIKPYHDGDLNAGITPYDASLILQNYVQLISLTPYQKIAADVSGNGTLTPWDASQVLRYYVGDIPEFEIGKDWTFIPTSFQINDDNWNTAPDSLVYNPLTQKEINQDFYGIIYGDVSGNWTYTGAKLNKNQPDLLLSSIFKTEPIYGLPGTIIEIPFQFQTLNSTCSFGAMLEFDRSIFKLKEIVPGEKVQKWTLSYRQHGDTLKLALAGTEPVDGNSVLTIARFEISPDVKTGEYHDLLIHQLSLNEIDEIDATTRIQYIAKSLIPTSFKLMQNHPNPFNSSTEIRFELPEPGLVKLKIYNLQGQEVRRLLNEQREAGYHSIYFDGRNNQAQYLTSGVYIFTLETGANIETKKMILIR